MKKIVKTHESYGHEAEQKSEHESGPGQMEKLPGGLVESEQWLREESDSGIDIGTNR